jgi:elongation factor G
MPARRVGTRNVALVGPGGAGKTSLAEAILFAAGAIDRQGNVDAKTSVGDASPEARSRGGSTELNLMNFEFLGDRFALIDCPGSIGFAADGGLASPRPTSRWSSSIPTPTARCSPSRRSASSRRSAFRT